MYWLKSATYLAFIIQVFGPAKESKFKNLFSSIEVAPNDHFILVLDGIDKKLRKKKSELR